MNDKIDNFQQCIIAFERVKQGIFKYEDNKNREITAALISEEAGFDKGYLKNSRSKHQLLIKEINEFSKSQEKNKNIKTNYKEKFLKEEKKAKEYRRLYEESLSRELQLFHQLCIYEKELMQLKKLN